MVNLVTLKRVIMRKKDDLLLTPMEKTFPLGAYFFGAQILSLVAFHNASLIEFIFPCLK